MVICEAFISGSCSAGKLCKYEHVDIRAIVTSDVKIALTGTQWALSSFGPFREKPSIDDFITDQSFEEVRYSCWMATEQGNFPAYAAQLTIQITNAKQQMRNLFNMKQDIYQKLVKLYNAGVPSDSKSVREQLPPKPTVALSNNSTAASKRTLGICVTEPLLKNKSKSCLDSATVKNSAGPLRVAADSKSSKSSPKNGTVQNAISRVPLLKNSESHGKALAQNTLFLNGSISGAPIPHKTAITGTVFNISLPDLPSASTIKRHVENTVTPANNSKATTPVQTNLVQNSTAVPDYIDAIKNDVKAALTGSQWALSCFGPFSEKPSLENFITDQSFEEIRYSFWIATKQGNFTAYDFQLTIQITNAKLKMQKLLNMEQDIFQKLVKLHSAEITSDSNPVQKLPIKPTVTSSDNSTTAVVLRNDSKSSLDSVNFASLSKSGIATINKSKPRIGKAFPISVNKTFDKFSKGILIRPKSFQSSKNTMDHIKSVIKPGELKTPIVHRKTLRNGSVILKTDTENNNNKLKTSIEENLGDFYTVENITQQKPGLIIYGLEKPYKSDELLAEIKNLNSSIPEDVSLDVVRTRLKKNRNKWCVHIEVSGNLYDRLVNRDIHIGFNRHRIHENYNVLRCFKCQKYGHLAKFCTSDCEVCTKCAGNHRTLDCFENTIRCANCAIRRPEQCQHTADSVDCPVFQKAVRTARKKSNRFL